MDDPTRRNILKAGAAAAAMAAMPRVFAQQAGKGGTGKFYEKGPVRIRYEEAGAGFPLMLLPGGGLNATIAFFTGNSPFNAIEEFKGQYRCITADLRNATTGQSTGPVEVDRPWESYADDQLGLMDHLGIDKFMVMGFCIGGPFIWSLLKRAPNRVVAAVLAQPVGWRPEMRDPKYPGVFWKTWGPALTAQRPEITMPTVDKFVTRMFETDPDFVFTVTRDFVRGCQTPILVLPDDVPGPPLRRRHGERDARAESRSEHVPLERTQRADSPGRAPNPFLPQGASACLVAGGDHTSVLSERRDWIDAGGAQGGTDAASTHAVTMTSTLAVYATGSKTWTRFPISAAAGVDVSPIASAAARPPPATRPMPTGRSDCDTTSPVTFLVVAPSAISCPGRNRSPGGVRTARGAPARGCRGHAASAMCLAAPDRSARTRRLWSTATLLGISAAPAPRLPRTSRLAPVASADTDVSATTRVR